MVGLVFSAGVMGIDKAKGITVGAYVCAHGSIGAVMVGSGFQLVINGGASML